MERFHEVELVTQKSTAPGHLGGVQEHGVKPYAELPTGERSATARVCGDMTATTAHSFADGVRQYWRDLKRGRPGHRFQDRYERARRERRKGGSPWQRVVTLTAGIACLAIGVVLSVIPGPAIPFFFLAGGLFGTESRLVARLMDWIEVRARKIAAWARRHWRRLPRAAQIALMIVGACCSAGMAYLSYRMMT